jgi:hypothetical protein
MQITTRIEADTEIKLHSSPVAGPWLEIGRQINLFADTQQLARLRDVIEDHLNPVDEMYADDGEHGRGGTGDVWLSANVEDMIARTEYVVIPRAEWDAMTPRQREAAVDQHGADTVTNAGGYGASVVVESDVPENER